MPDISTPTLQSLLTFMTVEDLKKVQRRLSVPFKAGNKADRVESLVKALSERSTLESIYESLDETQRLAVAETLYWTGGVYNDRRFKAKYRKRPYFQKPGGGGLRLSPYRGEPTPLTLLLLPRGSAFVVPVDTVPILKRFIDKPLPCRIESLASLPDDYRGSPLSIRHGESRALSELAHMLNRVEHGKVKVSDKTGMPGRATLQYLSEQLHEPDFYNGREKKESWHEEVGPIRAFAWPLILQASGLATRASGRLKLSRTGINLLGNLSADAIRAIWQRWLTYRSFDEFSRVNAIKGQKSKGGVMTAVADRRSVIVDALKNCPVDEWIEMDAFSRFMQAEGYLFDVTRSPWSLYIEDREYGSLGYDGYHGWNILQRRYMQAFLFEYAATLGLIDVAYVDPDMGLGGFGHMWGADGLSFLSRYDGMIYFRINSLGAYCLGLAESYVRREVQPEIRLSVRPNGQVTWASGKPSVEERLLLDAWCEKEGEGAWLITRTKVMAALERGMDIAEITRFLEQREEPPLPERVEALLNRCAENIGALKPPKPALLVECRDRKTAETIAGHKEARRLCVLAGDRHLVVQAEHEDQFRALIRVLGYGIPVQ